MMTSNASTALPAKLIAAPLRPECRAIIVIPVRDEAACLRQTLDAFAAQTDFSGRRLAPDSYEIIVFANNCCDESATIARRWQKENAALNVHIIEADLPAANANIGFVRRVLMNEAWRRWRESPRVNGVIITTDGDTVVDSRWIWANLSEIAGGAEAVGGRITISRADIKLMDAKARRFHLLDTGYRLAVAELEARMDADGGDFLPRHHQHYNASFAVTTEAFQAAGGVPEVRFLEDVAFYQALRRIDARFRHSPLVRVTTSARRAGRVECGLSTQISEWICLGKTTADYLVESAAAARQRIYWKNELRKLWVNAAQNAVSRKAAVCADALLVSGNFLRDELQKQQSFGVLLENVERRQSADGEWARVYPLAEVAAALADLRLILTDLRRRAAAPLQSFSHTSSR